MSEDAINWWQKPGVTGPSVSLSTFGWGVEQQCDVQLPYVTASICLPYDLHTGQFFRKDCHSPEELWEFIRAVDREPVKILQEVFNYTGPVFSERSKPIARTADELLSQLL